MTREEAKEALSVLKIYDNQWLREAIDMAIEALSSQNLTEPNNTCEVDLISRADALRELNGACSNWEDDAKVAEIINALPSADADRPHGEWIEKYNGNGWNDFWDYTCSNCGKKYERADAVLYHANYCPNCGARMKGGAE